MKLFLRTSLSIVLFFVASPFLYAQEPDAMPAIPPICQGKVAEDTLAVSLSDKQLDRITDLEKANFNFCGQKISFNSRERRHKLQNELRSISRSSSTLLQRANYYFPIVESILQKYNIPDDFKYLMVIESAMDPSARSPKGAAGIWQFMEGTARNYGLTVNERIDERFELVKATCAACRFLSDAYRRFGDWVAVAQSYNIGQARISTELAQQRVSEPLDLHLVEETNRYIYRIFAAKMIFTSPADFGLNSNLLYYTKLRRPSVERY